MTLARGVVCRAFFVPLILQAALENLPGGPGWDPGGQAGCPLVTRDGEGLAEAGSGRLLAVALETILLKPAVAKLMGTGCELHGSCWLNCATGLPEAAETSRCFTAFDEYSRLLSTHF